MTSCAGYKLALKNYPEETMRDDPSKIHQSLLQRSIMVGFLSSGILFLWAGISAERVLYLVIGILLGAGCLLLVFRDTPARMTRHVAENRGSLYMSFFSLFVPLGLFLGTGIGAAWFFFILISPIYIAIWEVLVPAIMMGACAVTNLVLLILNGIALAKQRA